MNTDCTANIALFNHLYLVSKIDLRTEVQFQPIHKNVHQKVAHNSGMKSLFTGVA